MRRLLTFLSVLFISVGTLMSVTFVLAPVGIPLLWFGALLYLPVYIDKRMKRKGES